MRIGFLTREYAIGDNDLGGLGYYLRRITLALVKAGHEPHVFYYVDLPSRHWVDNGVHIYIINSQPSKWVQRLNKLTRNRFRLTFLSLEDSLRISRYVKKIIRDAPLNIIQSTNYGLLCLLVTGTPLIIRVSSYRPLWDKYDHIRVRTDRKIYTKLEALQYRRARGVFAPTVLLAKIIENELGVKHVEVIRTPFYSEVKEMDPEIYDLELKGRDYLLFFGRLSYQKGIQVLADALPYIWKQNPEILAVFIGNDRNFDRSTTMTEYIKKVCSGYEKNLRFYPFLKHEHLYPIIQNSKLVVLPSYVDNAPNTLLEAMGFGKPVIGTYGSSMDEFIQNDVSGFLVQPGDPLALAQKICQAWEDPNLDDIGKQANKVISDLRPEIIVPQLLDFYKKRISINEKN